MKQSRSYNPDTKALHTKNSKSHWPAQLLGVWKDVGCHLLVSMVISKYQEQAMILEVESLSDKPVPNEWYPGNKPSLSKAHHKVGHLPPSSTDDTKWDQKNHWLLARSVGTLGGYLKAYPN